MLTFNLLSMALILGVSALVFSMHGQGGGLLYTPLQVFFGVDFYTAATRSHLFMVVTAVSSTIIFGRARRIDWPVALVLETAAGTGSFLGGLYAYRIPPKILMLALGTVVFFAALSMLMNLGRNAKDAAPKSSPWRWHREKEGRKYEVNLAAGLPLWFLIGILGGLTGVAGGSLKIPLMVLLFGMPIDIAFGSAALMVVVTASGGFAGHVTGSALDWPTTVFLGLFVAVGAQIGPRISLRSHPERLQHRFAYVLFAIAGIIFYLSRSA